MAADELTRALLLEEVSTPHAIAEALFASVSGRIPLLHALVDSGAATPDVLSRYLARGDAPFLRHVVPVSELVERLPRGLCERLLALPIRLDAITGTVDVVVADSSDPHPANEIGFHLRAPVRLVRAPAMAIEEALRRVQTSTRELSPPPGPNGTTKAQTNFTDPEKSLRRSLVIEPDSVPPPAAPQQRLTPQWGTPIYIIREQNAPPTPAPRAAEYGSEIPIPLTRKTFYPSDATLPAIGQPIDSFIPRPPPLPRWAESARQRAEEQPASFAADAPDLPFREMSGVLDALRNAGSRDEILELVLTGARIVAVKVALFVVKKGGYLGWLGTPEFADHSALRSILIPLEANSIFDRAVRGDLYLGPIHHDDAHAPLLRVMRSPSGDIAAVPVRVSGKTAVVIIADELADTMTGTRRLEELARAAGEAFGRILRTRR